MKNTSLGGSLLVRSWPRAARRVIAFAAVSLAAGAAWAQTYAVNTLAGSSSGFVFTVPSGAAVDGSGNVYVTDALNNAIKKITSAGTVSTLVNSGLSSPQGIAIDGSGNLYVADAGNGAVKKYTSAGALTATLATGLTTPLGIAVDSGGTTVYVADAATNLIKKIVVSGPTVTTLAGGGSDSPTSTSTTLTNAQFALPSGLALDSLGTSLYVADTNNSLIRKISLTGNTVSVVAGSTFGYTEGTGAGAQFKNPRGIAFFGSNLVVADTVNQAVRSVTTTGTTSLFAGTPGSQGSSDGLALNVAKFNNPSGIASDGTSVYVVDTTNQSVRKISVASAPAIGGGGQPSNQTVAVGGTATFTVSNVTGNPPVSYQWQYSSDTGVSWNNLSNGLLSGGTVSGATSASLSIANAAAALNAYQFRVAVSNGVGSTVNSSSALLTVTQPPTITNSSTTFTTTVNTPISNAQITASGSPAPNFNVTNNGTAFTQAGFSLGLTSGLITGTPTSTGSISFGVTASNTGGSSSQVTFTINVVSGPTISSQPSNQTTAPGNGTQFSVSANSNGGTLSYQWQFSSDSGASWNNLPESSPYSGTLTSSLTINPVSLSQNGYQFRVIVSSTIGSPTTSSAALLTVTQSPTITSLNNATFVENTSNSFTFQATGNPTPTFSITGGSLPSGVIFNPTTSTISGTPATGTSTSSPYVLTIGATNGVNPGASQQFTLYVTPTSTTPAFTTQPQNLTVALGQTATFTVVVTGTPTPTIQWQRQASGTSGFVNLNNDSTFGGVTSTTLTITNPASGMSGDVYQAVATNSNGSTTSSSATLTVVIGTTISTLAGQANFTGIADGTGSAARFNNPAGMAIDSAGNLYVADTANNTIRKVTSDGVVTTVAGVAGSAGSVDGPTGSAKFNAPSSVAIDALGNLYVADTYNHTIRQISPSGTVSTLAGSPGLAGTTDGLNASARFTYPYGVAVDSFGAVYVADTSNSTIRKIYNGSTSTFAGAAGIRGTANGNGSNARFALPTGLAIDSSNNIYVADSFNHTIRKISSAADVSTLAGNPTIPGTIDGTGSGAYFNQPNGVCVDSSGNVYVADTGNNTIRKVTPGGVVTTLAGQAGAAGYQDGTGTTARFNGPFGIAVDTTGNLFIADTHNQVIRRSGALKAPTITTQPQSQTVPVGGNATFTVAATGAPTPSIFRWQRQPAGTSGFVDLTEGDPYTGTATATLRVGNVTAAMTGDQFQVIVSNLISPNATSSAATLTVGTAPSITSANSATFQATNAGTFTITATGNPAPTFSASSLPNWATLNTTTGVITGTPANSDVGTFPVTITASNGITATQTLSITVLPAVLPPTITTQPADASVNQGQSTSLSVVVSGTSPFTYQWRRNGVAISGATSSTLTLSNAQPTAAGLYTVVVTNSAGAITSNVAQFVVNTAPVLTVQPRAQVVLAGSNIVLSADATGGTGFSYQWQKNGVAIPGATNSSLTLNAVTSLDAAGYDVIVSNGLGAVTSSLAQVTVVTTPVAPTITVQPRSAAALANTSVTLAIAATGAPAPTYQWRKNGAPVSGATGPTLTFGLVQPGDAANYDVVVTNSAGSITSSPAVLRVFTTSYSGVYLGTFSNNVGSFALYVRDDNTGVFLGYLTGSSAAIVNLNVALGGNGQFSFAQNLSGASGTVSVSGGIGTDGSVSGSISGTVGANLAGSRLPDTGTSQGLAGFYQAGSATNGATIYTIAGANGVAFAVELAGGSADGGTGGISGLGQVGVTGSRSSIAETISPASGTVTATSSGGISATFNGASEAILARQRLVNISTRARVGTGDNITIAGFVISGEEAKPVLIRAVGPTLAAAPFNISTALAAPKLDLFRGSTAIASNTGVASSPNAVAIAGAASIAGAFPLGGSGNDSAILTTLAPGNYTAQVSSATNASGVVLVEVYDLSAVVVGQKMLNISTRAQAGSGDATLIAGFVVPPGSTKRVLVRGIGPGLAQFGVPGTLAQPTLSLYNGSSVVATNTNYTSSADAAAITAASASVGAFTLANGDCAMIVTLAPGSYTAQIAAPGTTTGVALVEVYELP